jgi:uncharacterized protein
MQASAVSTIAPVSADERIRNIDMLRGFAVLGILAMNIVGFAFPFPVYSDPTVQGGSSGINLWVYFFNAFFVDGKMRGLFTLLFGAGVYLLATRAEKRGGGVDIADIYYRRLLWLLAFGVFHAYCLWAGEVLYPYAVLGLVLFPFRKMNPKGLLVLAGVLTVAMFCFDARHAYEAGEAQQKAQAAQALKAEGKTLTKDQQADLTKWEERVSRNKPDAESLQKTRAEFTGSFVSQVKARAKIVGFWHSIALYSPMQLDMLVMMLLGIALVKTGVLTGERSNSFYWKLAAAGVAVGCVFQGIEVYLLWRHWFELVWMDWAFVYYQPGRIGFTLAFVAFWMLIAKHGFLTGVRNRLAATGQMALTNYVAQSVICTFLFDTLKLYGTMQRYQIYYVVFAVWAVELAWSPIWLRNFRFGPLEWAWRSLTYWKKQPMRLRPVTEPAFPEPESPLPAES